MSDDRFGNLFTNPDFEIDEEDENFKLRNPSGVAATNRKKNNLDSDDSDSEVDAEEIEERGFGGDNGSSDEVDSDDDASSSDDEDGFRGGRVRGEAYEEMKKMKKQMTSKPTKAKKKKKTVSMQEAEELGNSGAVNLGLGDEKASARARRRLDEMNMPLAKRFAMMQDDDAPQVRVVGGSKEVTFIPRDTKKREESRKREEEGRQRGKRSRRGVKDLGFKKPFKNKGY